MHNGYIRHFTTSAFCFNKYHAHQSGLRINVYPQLSRQLRQDAVGPSLAQRHITHFSRQAKLCDIIHSGVNKPPTSCSLTIIFQLTIHDGRYQHKASLMHKAAVKSTLYKRLSYYWQVLARATSQLQQLGCFIFFSCSKIKDLKVVTTTSTTSSLALSYVEKLKMVSILHNVHRLLLNSSQSHTETHCSETDPLSNRSPLELTATQLRVTFVAIYYSHYIILFLMSTTCRYGITWKIQQIIQTLQSSSEFVHRHLLAESL